MKWFRKTWIYLAAGLDMVLLVGIITAAFLKMPVSSPIGHEANVKEPATNNHDTRYIKMKPDTRQKLNQELKNQLEI